MRLTVSPSGFDLTQASVREIEARGSYRETIGRELGVVGPELEVVVSANGRILRAEQYDDEADPAAEILLAPRPRGPALIIGEAWTLGTILVAGFITTVAAGGLFALGIAVQKLLGPKPEQQPADEESSLTYGWSGIRTGVGQGFRTPKVYGYHRVGGHLVASRFRTLQATTPAEVLDLVVLLSDGRCESVAGITGGAAGEIDRVGEFLQRNPDWPTGIFVDGNELQPGEAELSLRLGRFTQTPFAAMPSASTVVSIQGELNRVGHTASGSVPTADARRVRLKIEFPAGLYKQDRGSGQFASYFVGYKVTWREASSALEYDLDEFQVQDLRRERFWIEREYTIPADVAYVVNVRRHTDEGNSTSYFVASESAFAALTYEIEGVIAYAGRTVALLSLLANEKQQDDVQTITFPMKGRRVRVWDATHGYSEPLWELPASGPFSGIWSHPPGQNPAWVFLDLCLDYEGLNMLAEKALPLQPDLPALRDFADRCDETLDGRARFTFDGVFDAGDSIWDALARVAAVGMGVPILRGDTISIGYEYRDAHGRGTNSVPARARVALISSADVEGFEITYRDTTLRPNVIDVQILNAALDFEQDLVSVEDIEAAGLNEPYRLNAESVRRATVQLFGCTDPKRAREMAIYFHLLNRLARTEIACVSFVDKVALETKDIVGVQHDVFRPFENESFGYRTTSGGNVAALALDHDVELDSGIGQTWVLLVDTTGAVVTRRLTDPDGYYAAGTALNLSSAVTVARGAAVVLGFLDEIVRDYVVTKVSRVQSEGQQHKRKVEAIEWTPDAFDVPASFSLLDDHGQAAQGLGASAQPPTVEGVAVEPLANGATRIGMALPHPFRGRRARVSVSRWDGKERRNYDASLAEQIAVEGLEPHRDYVVRVAVEDRNGRIGSTVAGTEFYLRAPEFPATSPGRVTGLRSVVGSDGVWLIWDPLDDSSLDYYEVRRGSNWIGAEIVGRTKESSLLILRHASRQQTYMVRARHRRGVYSAEIASLAVTPGVLPGMLSLGSVTDLESGAAGTATGCAWDGALGALVLSAGKTEATYQPAQLNLTTLALRYWSVSLDRAWLDVVTTFADCDFTFGSGEARWWTFAGREPSQHKPGGDLWTTFSTYGGLFGDGKGTFNGPPGSVGRHCDVRIEARYDETGSGGWSSWAEFRPGWRKAAKIEVRFQLRRASALKYSLRVKNCRIEAMA